MRWRELAAWEMEENGCAGCPYMNNYPPLDLALSTALVSNSSPAMVSSLVQVLAGRWLLWKCWFPNVYSQMPSSNRR